MKLSRYIIILLAWPALWLVACSLESGEVVLGNQSPEMVWQQDTGGAIDRPPQVVRDVVVVIPQGGYLVALDRYDGQE
ncbi:MAG: hypothetical protein D6803_00245, partial [Anaerolineae bacterium]